MFIKNIQRSSIYTRDTRHDNYTLKSQKQDESYIDI